MLRCLFDEMVMMCVCACAYIVIWIIVILLRLSVLLYVFFSLAFQSLQNIIVDLNDWRSDVVHGK